MAKRKAAKKAARKGTRKTARKAARHELIDTGSDKRYMRRGGRGRFQESDDLGRATAGDRRRRAKKKAKRGQGDRGDR